jgi:hypothetical protein
MYYTAYYILFLSEIQDVQKSLIDLSKDRAFQVLAVKSSDCIDAAYVKSPHLVAHFLAQIENGANP